MKKRKQNKFRKGHLVKPWNEQEIDLRQLEKEFDFLEMPH